MNELNPIALKFWRTPQGNEPVREFLTKLDSQDKKVIGQNIRSVQFGWPVGMPLVRSLGKSLHELRSSLSSRTEVRVMFASEAGEMFLLHAFVKKSQKTPDDELEIARRRLKDLKS